MANRLKLRRAYDDELIVGNSYYVTDIFLCWEYDYPMVFLGFTDNTHSFFTMRDKDNSICKMSSANILFFVEE